MTIYSDKIISLSQEYFFNKRPLVQSLLIWIILLLLTVAGIWAGTAKFEEVIKVSGFIRPQTNISSVSNAITGKVLKVNYKTGQKVFKGEELLQIDSTQLEKERENIQTELEENRKKLSALQYIQKSIISQENVIPQKYSEAHLRFDEWHTNYLKKEAVKNYNFYILERERKLPRNMTTVSKIREYEYSYEMSCREYEDSKISFEHAVAKETDELKTLIKIKEANLAQIEDSLLYTKITAPIDGIIQESFSINEGDWIQSGQNLFNIIPHEKDFIKVELSVPAKQAGKICEGMAVKMRFPSLPYHEFGGAEGTIITITPDITMNAEGEAIFIIKTDLDKLVLSDKQGKEYPLKTGLQTDARIIVSKKTLFLFMLEKMNLWY